VTWCLVSREFPPHTGGGIGTYAASFARHAAARGRRTVVVTAHDAPRAEHTEANLTVIRLPLQAGERWDTPHPDIDSPATRRAWAALGPHSVFSMQVAGLRDELVSRFAVTTIEGCDTGAPLWRLLDQRPVGDPVRIITHVHSPSAWIEPLNRRLEQGRWMHELQRAECEQARRSDAVVTPSHAMARWLDAHWSVRAEVIAYPLPPGLAPGRAPAAREVLFAGRLEYRKGIDTLLRAWPLVSTDATLCLAGADTIDYRTGRPIGASLLARLPEAARVQALGPLAPDRLAERRARAAVAVVPSPDDNYPFTCIEAMAAGRCVVAADAGGAAEMIDHGRTGLLFPPGDAHALARCLEHALAMPDAEREDIAAAAARSIAHACDPDRIIAARLAHAAAAARNDSPPPSPEHLAWRAAPGPVPPTEAFTGGRELAAGWALRIPSRHAAARRARFPRLFRR
jgi:glycosyltransferase involved in cell wall biosynthesis